MESVISTTGKNLAYATRPYDKELKTRALGTCSACQGKNESTTEKNAQLSADTNLKKVLRAAQFLLGPFWKTLKSGCLSLLTIRSFGARDGLGLSVRVWFEGFG
eukprot:sb/3478036/